MRNLHQPAARLLAAATLWLVACSRSPFPTWQSDWAGFVGLIESKLGNEAPITYGVQFDRKAVQWEGKAARVDCESKDATCKVVLSMSPGVVRGEGVEYEVAFVAMTDAATADAVRKLPPQSKFRFGVTLKSPGMVCFAPGTGKRIALVISEQFRLL